MGGRPCALRVGELILRLYCRGDIAIATEKEEEKVVGEAIFFAHHDLQICRIFEMMMGAMLKT
jgi:hypothetical protein